MNGKMPWQYENKVKIYWLKDIEETPRSKVTKSISHWEPLEFEFDWNDEGMQKAYDLYLLLKEQHPHREFKVVLEKRELKELVYSPKMKKLVQFIKD